MSRIVISSAIAIVLTTGILLGLAGYAGAQSQLPIFFDDDEEPVACVVVGEEFYVAKYALVGELETLTQQVAMVAPLGLILAQLPPASSSNAVRFEGGQPVGEVADALVALGYGVETLVAPLLPSADGAALRTQ